MYGYRGPAPPPIAPYPPLQPALPGAPGEIRYQIDDIRPHGGFSPYPRGPRHSIRDTCPPGEENFSLVRKERRPPPPPNPYDYAPRRGRTRSPRHRRPRSRTGSRSRSRSLSPGRSKKSRRKGKKKSKRSRSSSSSSSTSDSRSRSRSNSPNEEYSKWLDVIKKMDSKDASIASTAVLPPSVVAKLTAAGLWPPPGQVNPYTGAGPSGGLMPPYFPGQSMAHLPPHVAPTGAPPAALQSEPSIVSAPFSVEERKDVVKEMLEKKEELGDDKQKVSGLNPEQEKKLTEQRDKFKNAQDMIVSELFQLQCSHAELLTKMFSAETVEDVSSHSGLITENMKLQNEMLTKLKDINKVVKKCTEALKETSGPEGLVRMEVQYFDPKNHFCADCKIFCDTASDYLQHCTTVLHKKFAKCGEDKAWRKKTVADSDENKTFDKTAPLKGLPFMLPVDAFYCKLCDVWAGDKDDTLKHLNSAEHNHKYLRFAVDHPEWETELVQKRQKAAKTTIKQGLEKRAKVKEEAALRQAKNEKPEEKEKSEDRKPKEKKHDDVDMTTGGRSIRVNMRESVIPKREVIMEPAKNSGKDPLLEAWAGEKNTEDTESFAALRNKLRKKMESPPPRLPPKVEVKNVPIPSPPPRNGSEKQTINLKPFFIGKMPIKKVNSRDKSPSPSSKKQKSPERSTTSRRDTNQRR